MRSGYPRPSSGPGPGLNSAFARRRLAAFATGSRRAPAAAAEYGFTPGPTPVAGLETPVLPLDGTWKFQPGAAAGFWTLNERSAAAWPAIQVPGDWTMQGFAVKPGTAAGYLKTVTIPKAWAGRRILLRFDGVQSEAKVWVNGRPAGSHEGGFNAFELDVTALVQPGAAAPSPSPSRTNRSPTSWPAGPSTPPTSSAASPARSP